MAWNWKSGTEDRGEPVVFVHGAMGDECAAVLAEPVLANRFRLIHYHRRERDVLQPEVVSEAIRKAVERLTPATDLTDGQRNTLEKRIATTTRDLERLTAAIVDGGDAPTLVAAIRQRENDLATSRRELASLELLTQATTLDPDALQRDLRAKIEEWRELLGRHIPQARQVLKKLLVGPLRFTPHRNGEDRHYEFTAQIALGRVFNGIAGAIWVASPGGRPFEELELPTSVGLSHRQSAIFFAVKPAPIAPLGLRQVRKRACLDFERRELLEQLRAQRRRKTVVLAAYSSRCPRSIRR
jgi:hypothetical protein